MTWHPKVTLLRYQWYFTFTNYGLITVTIPDDHEDLSYFLNSRACLLTAATLVDTDYYSEFAIQDQIDGVLYSVLFDDCSLLEVTTKAIVNQEENQLCILPGFTYREKEGQEKKYCFATADGVITSEESQKEIESSRYLVA